MLSTLLSVHSKLKGTFSVFYNPILLVQFLNWLFFQVSLIRIKLLRRPLGQALPMTVHKKDKHFHYIHKCE